MNISEALTMAMTGQATDEEMEIFDALFEEYKDHLDVTEDASLSLPALAYTFFTAGRIFQSEAHENEAGQVTISLPVSRVQALIDLLVEEPS